MPRFTVFRRLSAVRSSAALAAAAFFLTAPDLLAQSTPASQAPTLPVVRVPITVVAQKEPAPADRVTASLTALPGSMLEAAGITTVSDAAIFAPNAFYADLSARKVSNARFRGIGSSPANPGVTTYVDGVPQLNSNSANFEVLDVEQVEFVRGAQSALFGRNTLGGVVNVTSRRPSLSAWSGRATVPLGNNADRGIQAGFEGPIVADRLGASFAFGYSERDGFTRNTTTNTTVDDRSAFAAKGQLYFRTSGPWQAHVVVSGERDRDGDYTLGDLAAIRQNPFTVMRDYNGRTDRDLFSTAVIARREGARMSLTSTTGLVHWSTFDETDLDYTAFPAATRANDEEAMQFTQEVRLASSPKAPVRLSTAATLAWQAGLFVFTQGYEQDAVNRLAPYVLSLEVPFAVENHSPEATLDDVGMGAFGHATVTLHERIDVSAGLRVDRETRDAELKSFFMPAIAPPTTVERERTFSSVSPQVAVAFRPREGHTVYGSVGKGFKAGGFNPASPAGSEEYAEEQAWHVEGGVKALMANGRVAVTAAIFNIDWQDMQLNLPNPFVPAQFYIANAGQASSRGVEVDVNTRVHEELSLFGSIGLTRARFENGSLIDGTDVSGNKVPFTPAYTAMVGAEFLRPVNARTSVFARGEVVGYGAFEYDDLNTARQDAYALTNIRAGVRVARFFVEAWVRNAFDTKYVPIALAFNPSSAPSGFIGEPGKPRTFGIRAGVGF